MVSFIVIQRNKKYGIFAIIKCINIVNCFVMPKSMETIDSIILSDYILGINKQMNTIIKI